MKSTVKINYFLFFALFVFVFTVIPAGAQKLLPVAQVTIPNWNNTAPLPSFDLLSFDPNSKVMYVADRNNGGVSAINTLTNTYIGTIPGASPCGLGTANTQCTSGIIVAPDLKELIVTDRGTATNALNCATGCGRVFIYDISTNSVPT